MCYKNFTTFPKTNSVNLPNFKKHPTSNIQQMNNYTEFNFKIQPLEPWNEILMAELIEIGFDSFTEELEGILAYIPTNLVNEENFKTLEIFNNENVKISYTFQEMPNFYRTKHRRKNEKNCRKQRTNRKSNADNIHTKQ